MAFGRFAVLVPLAVAEGRTPAVYGRAMGLGAAVMVSRLAGVFFVLAAVNLAVDGRLQMRPDLGEPSG